MSAAEAGRKGGRSRSAAKLAAARRNGFQPCREDNQPTAPPPVVQAQKPAPVETPQRLPLLLTVFNKENR
jgi:hypothetical protein